MTDKITDHDGLDPAPYVGPERLAAITQAEAWLRHNAHHNDDTHLMRVWVDKGCASFLVPPQAEFGVITVQFPDGRTEDYDGYRFRTGWDLKWRPSYMPFHYVGLISYSSFHFERRIHYQRIFEFEPCSIVGFEPKEPTPSDDPHAVAFGLGD